MILMPRTSLKITNRVQGMQNFFCQLSCFCENRFDHVGCRVGKSGQIVVFLDLQDVIEHKQTVFNGRAVGCHSEFLISLWLLGASYSSLADYPQKS